MKHFNPLSLSLQKEIAKRNICLESEIERSINSFGFRTMLHRCGIYKQKGYPTISILYMMILLPFIKKCMTSFWTDDFFHKICDAHKDTYYRFLNNERFNWRKFIYMFLSRIINRLEDRPLREKVLIADDTILPKSGKQMELVSYHFDHAKRRSILGYQCLQLGYHDGFNFYPVDMAGHTSKNRTNHELKQIDKRTNGWKRRKEVFEKKNNVLLEMLKRSKNHGIEASFVMFDSWFSYDALISQTVSIGYGVICRLKRGKIKYGYNGNEYTLKQLWTQVAKKKTVWLPGMNVKGVSLKVSLPQTGQLQVLFVSDGKKQWHPFLCTDLWLEPSEILKYYARRWSIEIFFKDTKQLLYLGKEQSRTFDAVIAGYSLVMIRYLLLVYILARYGHRVSLGPLFQEMVETHLQMFYMAKIWDKLKELMFVSSPLVCPEIDPDNFVQLIDMLENIIMEQLSITTAKL